MLPAATLQALLSSMVVQAVKNTYIKTEHSKLMRNEYTNKLRCRYNTTHNLLFAYILEVFTMNERYKLNVQLAQMLKGGVIMDVTTLEQARIAEAAGACAVMALEKIPADIRAAGGVATPADAALMMQLGAEGVFVGSGIFKSGDPAKRTQAIVKAVTNFNDAKMLAELSEDLGEAMVGINEPEIQLLMAERGK